MVIQTASFNVSLSLNLYSSILILPKQSQISGSVTVTNGSMRSEAAQQYTCHEGLCNGLLCARIRHSHSPRNQRVIKSSIPTSHAYSSPGEAEDTRFVQQHECRGCIRLSIVNLAHLLLRDWNTGF